MGLLIGDDTGRGSVFFRVMTELLVYPTTVPDDQQGDDFGIPVNLINSSVVLDTQSVEIIPTF